MNLIYKKPIESLNEHEMDLMFTDLLLSDLEMNGKQGTDEYKELMCKRVILSVLCSVYGGDYSRSEFNVVMDLFIPNPKFDFSCINLN